ncbi:MAG: glycine cleavage system aminomethyltransferase GcvT, partial [Solirubrobacteraceae bacterium]
VFDVSHMGQIETSGPGAVALLERLLTNDVGALAVGGAGYGVLCREDGGILDDVITYRVDAERYLTVTNAANHERDLSWFADHAGDGADVIDRAPDYAMIAVQGPLAREIVQAIASAPLPERMAIGTRTLNGVEALVAGTGYTGEDGVEILVDPRDAPGVWTAILRRGAMPAGLAARDTLRTEVCYPLYGNELGTERGPIEAGLGWCCRSAGGYVGADAVAAARTSGTSERLVPFVLDVGVPRAGDPVLGGGAVTSGTYSPSLEVGIGMAYLAVARAQAGAEIDVDVRGRVRHGTVRTRPLYG